MIYTLQTSCSKEFWPLVDLTLSNKLAYCVRHQYQLDLRKFEAFSYVARVDAMEHALGACDWLLFMGADTLITNLAVNLDALIDPAADWIVAEDIHGINNDVFLMQNTPASRAFLQRTKDLIGKFPHDQSAMHAIAAEIRTKRVAGRVLNACNYANYPYGPFPPGEWQRGDFVFHVPGMSLEAKLRRLREKLPEVTAA